VSESSFWRRSWFKSGKVWVECDATGQPIDRDGKVVFAYKKGDTRTYTTALSRLRPLEGSGAEEGGVAIPPEPSRDSASKKRPAASTSSGKRSDDEIFGGSRADVENPAAIHLWSDGACSGNPGPAGAGTVLLFGDRRKEMSTWLGEGTNNVAELVAVLQGLEALRLPVRRKLVVHTDSKYVIGVVAQGWKARANGELVQQLRERLDGIGGVVWHWVRGHEGVELNERCDALARLAIERRESTVETLP
jgi:ribonuclease HI